MKPLTKLELFSLRLQYILVFPGLKDSNVGTASKDMKNTKIMCTYITPLGCRNMQSNIKKQNKNRTKKNVTKR